MRQFLQILIPVFFLLALVTAVVYVVIAWRRREGAVEERGLGTTRRLYFYLVSLVALLMGFNGIVQMVVYLLDSAVTTAVAAPSTTRLAVGISLAVVGLPLWAVHWALVQRYVRALPVERSSLPRKFYMYLVLGISIALVLNASLDVLRWLLRLEGFRGYPWAAAVVWSGVWWFHWRLETAEGQPAPDTRTLRRLYLYVVALFGLVLLSVGVGRAMAVVLGEGYDALFGQRLVPGETAGLWRPPVREAVAALLVGASVWACHWFLLARGDRGSLLRQVYLYLFAVLGGVVTALAGLGVLLNDALVWLMGAAERDAVAHFRSAPGALATLAVGGALWAYHREVLTRESMGYPGEVQRAQRVYIYLMSALGVALVSVSAITVVSTAVGLLAGEPSLLTGGAEWRRRLTFAITTGALGLPLWVRHWWLYGRALPREGPEEAQALSRLVFLIALLTVGVLGGLGAVSYTLFVLLRDALEGTFSAQTARDLQGAVGVLGAVALFLPYYWGVYRRERGAYREERRAEAPPKKVSVLAADADAWLVRALEDQLGRRVAHLRWAGAEETAPVLTEGELQEVARRIAQAPGRYVLVLPQGGRLRLLSYD